LEPPKRRATYKDLYNLPGNMTGEIIRDRYWKPVAGVRLWVLVEQVASRWVMGLPASPANLPLPPFEKGEMEGFAREGLVEVSILGSIPILW
jgi:hypothetical protein